MRTTIVSLGFLSLAISCVGLAAMQSERTFKWKVHDMDRPQPTKVDPGAAGPVASAPSDAVVLFGGSSPNLAKWTSGGEAAKWKVTDGVLTVEPGSGDITTRDQFGDVQAHIEWMIPADRKVDGQHGGNSGVFFMDRYELQVLSSNGNVTYADGMAGSLYGQYPPLVNPCRPQGQWNVYDVVFRAPVFGGDGTTLHPATVTAFLNGVLVQDNTELLGDTVHGARTKYTPHPPTGPIHLQDHGDPINYRNIWVRPLAPRGVAE